MRGGKGRQHAICLAIGIALVMALAALPLVRFALVASHPTYVKTAYDEDTYANLTVSRASEIPCVSRDVIGDAEGQRLDGRAARSEWAGSVAATSAGRRGRRGDRPRPSCGR
jgi:hypothetical protein